MNAQRSYEIAFRLGANVDDSFRRSFNTASAAVEQAGANTEALNRQSGQLNKTMKISEKAALAAGAAFVGVAAGLGAALNAADEYGSAMKQVQASTGSSVEEMAEIKEISKNLYNKNLGQDWNDLAESLQSVKSVTDLSGKSLETATKYAIQYRDVFKGDVAESIKTADTMMKNFGITADESYNLLAQGAQRGLDKSGELLDSANEYAPYFNTLGFDANQMFDIFNTGLKNGAFNLDKVGDAIKEFNIRSKDGSKTSIAAYNALGLSADEMTQTFARGGPEAQKAFKTVVNAISSVKDPAEQNAIAVGLFGTQAEDLEMKVLKSLGNVKSTFDMTKTTMEEVGEIKYDTVGNAIKGIGRQFETGVVIPLGEKVLPHLSAFSNYLANELPADVKAFINLLSTIAPVVVGLTTSFLVYRGTLAGVAAAQIAFNLIQRASIVLYNAHRAAMIAYTLYGGGLKGVIAGMRAAMASLNLTMAANPILLVVAALAGLGVAFYAAYKMSDTFRNKVDGAFARVKEITSSTVAYFTAVAPILWDGFIDSTQKAWSKIEGVFNQSIGYIGTKIAQFSQWLNGLTGTAGEVVNYIKGSFEGIGNTLATLSPLIARMGLSFLGVSGPIGWVIASVISIGAFLYKLIKTNEEVRTSLLNAWTAVQSAIKPVLELFALAGQTLLSMLIPATTEISKSFATLGPEFQKTGQIIKDSFVQLGPAFAQLGPAFAELGSAFASLFGELATSLIPILVQGFTSLMPVLSQLFSTWINLSSTLVTSDLPLLLSGVQTIFPMILTIIQMALPFVVKLLSGIIPVVIQIATMILPLILQAVQLVFPPVLAIIQTVLPIIIQLIVAIIPIIMLLVKTAIPLILQVVQMVFPLVLAIIQAALPIVTLLLKGLAGFLTNIVVPAIQLILKIVQFVFPLVLSIIQAVIPIVTLLLKGVSAFLTNIVVPAIQALLKIVQFVFPLIMTAINNALTFITGILKTFTSILKGDWSGAWNNIKDTAKTIMNNIIKFFDSINLFDIGKKIIGGLVDGIKSMANVTLGAIGGIVNGVIKGINWVLDKVGVEVSLNEWKVPKYAKGTNSHPGGPAILGDGGGPELFRTPNGSVGLSPGTDTLMNLPKGTQVIPHRETAKIMNQYNIPAYKNGTGITGAVKTGWNWVKETGSTIKEKAVAGASKVKEVALDVFSYIEEPSKLLNVVLDKFGVTTPNIAGTFGDVAKGSFTLIKEKAVAFIKEKLEGFGSWSGGTGAPGDVQKWLTAAINITGVPMSWLGPLQTMAMKESGGNPRAINLWDSNAKRGTPSKGLMQTIDPTFNAYKMSGMNDIWNPIHNAVASIRYTQSRYGSIFNTPGIASMASGGGYKGYYQGGTVPNTQYAWVGERGPELMKIPGGASIRSNPDSQSMMSSMLKGLFSFSETPTPQVSGGGGTTVNIEFAPVIHAGDSTDSNFYEKLLGLLSNASDELKLALIKLLQDHENDKKRRELR
ncbi:phage tail tape measure protein [Niallia taxi]|uniref:phage tail tape measure protein n=1 Tax=Niallia taxi TaxID=2499688 RepID=UPI0039822CC9